ncbi:MAG: hypothetical protein ACM32J_13995 [Rhizobacter sp.]
MRSIALWLAVMCVGAPSAFAAPSPEATKVALQQYLGAIGLAGSMADLASHWSRRFADENRAAASRLAALPAETRALVERRSLQALRQIATEGPGRFVITCSADRCAARTPLAGGLDQTFWFVEEAGAVKVDGSNTHAGPGTPAR